MNSYRVDVFNIVGGEYCIEADEGQKIFEIIKKAINENLLVIVSFRNIKRITTAFLNNAIGQLLRDYKEEDIKAKVSYEDVSDVDRMRIKRVNQTAKLFYSDPGKMKRVLEEIMGE
jgi:STAS-like domain of unknown function (DUF4325)